MHMADALLSPVVGGVMWAASAATIAVCSARVRSTLEDRKFPLMGVLGAFVFAAQMINFSIPGTGSSGHLGGALLLAILLGPSAAFLTIASVLVVQALFFADGGLLALGCNIINMGFFPSLVVFPLFHQRLTGNDPSRKRFLAVTVLSAVIGYQLGSLAVVVETCCSGVTSLPPKTFLLLMQPVHLVIGLVEGVVTAAVISFLRRAHPDVLAPLPGPLFSRKVVTTLLLAAVLTAGVLSALASKEPDGLEWSVAHVAGKQEPKAPQYGIHTMAASLQGKSAWLRDYRLSSAANGGSPADLHAATPETSFAGVVGALLTLLLVFCAGFVLKRRGQGGGTGRGSGYGIN